MNISYLPPLTLYIHFPWCVQKCPYCDFNSHGLEKINQHKINYSYPEDEYIDALLKDLDEELPAVWGRSISAIFIGGGTPSLMGAKNMERLLSGIRARLPFLSNIEITMEANPGTVEADKFSNFYQAGVNRISIGIQSFDNQFLKTLGRIHNEDEATQAFYIARNAGFKNINIDLMYALPDQSIEQAMQDLSKAIELKPEHLSWYQLTLEANTAFHHSPPKNMADEDRVADISEQGLTFLKEKDYYRYEVSAFSRDGKGNCWHNTNYWQFGDYIGIGAGAHGKITRADTQEITRTSKKRNPKDYLNPTMPFIDKTNVLSADQMPFEFMLNALRLVDGVEASSFYERTGILNQHIDKVLSLCRNRKLINLDTKRIQTTQLGFQYLNEVLSEFSEDRFPLLTETNKIKIRELT